MLLLGPSLGYVTFLERRGSVVVSTSVWHAAGQWFDSRTRHVSLNRDCLSLMAH